MARLPIANDQFTGQYLETDCDAKRDAYRDLRKAAIALSDSLMGGAAYAVTGRDRGEVTRLMRNGEAQFIRPLERLNAALREIDMREKGHG